MASHRLVHLFPIILLFTISTGYVMASPPAAIKAAYWPSWSKTFPPSAIDTTLFTHILYAFLVPSNVTFKFEVSDSAASLLENFTGTLHRKNPPVKTLVSFGGGGSDPKLFARMASNKGSRKIFIDSAIQVARTYGFDGMDLDWEFPKNPEEMAGLGQLFKEWRSTSPSTFNGMETTGSIQWNPSPKSLDWVNAMCFDYRGSWDTSATGAHAALYDPNSNISTSYGLTSWVRAGVPRNMVVMGLPLYGRTWQLKDPKVNGIGAPATAVGPGDDGVLIFSEVEKFNRENGATVVYDAKTVSTYSHAGTSWIGYDDSQSTTVKLEFAQAHGLRGYFFWALSYDREWEISKQASRTWVTG
ncbi:NOD FACTOR HYDROLASE PROTEIN 1 [Salix purpurea]|uniref:NOD FACTOR HYDROLASE PROTEIN 1 n=1 Tax=Salix purpurea TaxID=77065 RepID=A0A9Q0UL22_SALPP|nr:NOD FACTOR HYDROLASE PROTEIN 1 [Salix purpurea]